MPEPGPETGADARRRPQPEEAPLQVIFEDEALLVVEKPAGVVVHPTYKNTSGTLLNAVLWRVRHREDAAPGILTRLDKQTSGLVVIALSTGLHAVMQRDLAQGRVRKEYLAVVCGTPDPAQGRITLPLARDTADRRRVVVTPDGAACETRYEVVRSGAESVLRCDLVTGRTHQIRVHLAASGWPIVGDPVYGTPDDRIARQALHAWRVVLPHPVTRAPLAFESPPPADVAQFLRGTDLGGEPQRGATQATAGP